MLILAISWKVLKGLKLNHNAILDLTWIISPYSFHKRLFSLSCLGVQVRCWITSSDFYRLYSHLRSIFRFQRSFCLICLCLVYVRYFVTNNVYFRNIFVFSIPWLGLAKLKNWTVNKLNFLVKHVCVSLSEQVESVTHFSTS